MERTFSKPRAMTQSAMPYSTAWRASHSADEPVEQLLFTLRIGIFVRPSAYSARWPQVESP